MIRSAFSGFSSSPIARHGMKSSIVMPLVTPPISPCVFTAYSSSEIFEEAAPYTLPASINTRRTALSLP